MMKLTKRLLSTLLVLCMVLSMLPTIGLTASAADTSATWTLVTDASTLQAGDVIILACDTKSVYAGAMDGQKYFSSVDSISSAIEITLGGATGAWTLTTSEGTIGTSAAKSLNCTGSGTTTWSISVSTSGTATITSTTSAYGSIKYNSSSPRFLNYASGQTAIQIYKKSSATTVTLESIAVQNPKVEYIVGDDFVEPTVIGTYSDGTTADVTSGCTFTGYDMSAEDIYTVTVTHTVS
ncbi:MAG: hypothetical protein ACI4V3_05810, partial [Faecousia sp.]